MPELNFDGLVGPTHNFAGLGQGNLAAQRHAGNVGNPRSAALEGLAKMRILLGLGVPQAVLPPQARPDLIALRRVGFSGSDGAVLQAARSAGLLNAFSSASSMWTANAATVVPAADSHDGKLHLVPANLSAQSHRSLEAPTTTRALRAIFNDAARFVVHDPLPCGPYFSDEGAANHTRLVTSQRTLHLFGWGRSEVLEVEQPHVHRARQCREASEAVARLCGIRTDVLFRQQSPAGIDAGSFHSDVLCVGHRQVLLCHELAFVEPDALFQELRRRLGDELEIHAASNRELPVGDAVASYPFNSQLVTTAAGTMVIVAPSEARDVPSARGFLERVVAESSHVGAIHWASVNESMRNGGGPACLRLRVELTGDDMAALPPGVLMTEAKLDTLEQWVHRHYRPELSLADLADPALWRECCAALDELTGLLGLGSIYEFQIVS
ncbi:MAG: N-succinylarginine dihydrolase [Polyangiaceae bacterium]